MPHGKGVLLCLGPLYALALYGSLVLDTPLFLAVRGVGAVGVFRHLCEQKGTVSYAAPSKSPYKFWSVRGTESLAGVW